MSAIKAELMKAAALTAKRGETEQDLIERIVLAVAEIPDKDWNALSQGAQDYYNEAADAYKAKAKTLPTFPDAEEEQEQPAATTRRGAAAAKPAEPAVGDVAKVTTKRGVSETGTIVELDDEVVVIKMGDGTEKEFAMSRVESIETQAVKGADEPEADPVKVGAVLKITNKRGKVYEGKVVEVDEEAIVLEVDGKDEAISKDRVETIEAVGGKKPEGRGRAADKEQEQPAATTRRGKAEEPAGDAEKPKRSSNPAGVSVGGRIRELMCEDLEITQEEIGKILKKEGIEFRDTSLNMIFKDTTAVFNNLRANKKLK